jgi:hypothetical protein
MIIKPTIVIQNKTKLITKVRVTVRYQKEKTPEERCEDRLQKWMSRKF